MLLKSIVLILSLAVFASLVSCNTPQSGLREEVEEFHSALPVRPNMGLSVEGKNGDITIRTWEKDSLDISAVKKTRVNRRELKKVKIEVDSGENIFVKSKYSDKNAKVSVHYHIRVPRYLIIDEVKTTNGSVELKGASGDASIATQNGKITVGDMNGYISAHTQNGAIEISNTTGVTEAETSNGSIKAEILHLREGGADFTVNNGFIKLYVFPRLDADIEMKVSNGTIAVHGLDAARLRSTPNRITGTLGKGGPRIYASTSNGNIDLLKLGSED
jgi:DUF4097 and DUF4098 domain-containing protein YvlB